MILSSSAQERECTPAPSAMSSRLLMTLGTPAYTETALNPMRRAVSKL